MKPLVLLIFLTLTYCMLCHGETNQPSPQLYPSQIESRFLELLSAGKQSEAEDLIETYTSMYPNNQRMVFLRASCLRSRFMVREAAPLFASVIELEPNSVYGKGALQILYLDLKKEPGQHFEVLRRLVLENPNDMMLRWMIAVQCRAYDKNEEGMKHFQKLLEKWNPGPVLVHQTYGNLLDELKRHVEALVEHRKAAELEPKGWSYQGLGNTLVLLNRCADANEIFKKSVELSPERSEYWQSWAWGLLCEGKFDESIAKCEKAITLNPENYIAWEYWGRCLELQGKLQDALQKYRKSVMINGTDKFAKYHVKDLEEKIAAQSHHGKMSGQPLKVEK